MMTRSSHPVQPEPLLSQPEFVSWRAKQGLGVPAYAYASNNPITRVDPDGNADTVSAGCMAGSPSACAAAGYESAEAARRAAAAAAAAVCATQTKKVCAFSHQENLKMFRVCHYKCEGGGTAWKTVFAGECPDHVVETVH